jgi:hypothetical protein
MKGNNEEVTKLNKMQWNKYNDEEVIFAQFMFVELLKFKGI